MDQFQLLYAALTILVTGLIIVSCSICYNEGRTHLDMMNTIILVLLEPWAVSLTCAEAKTSIHGRDSIMPQFLIHPFTPPNRLRIPTYMILSGIHRTPRMDTPAALRATVGKVLPCTHESNNCPPTPIHS